MNNTLTPKPATASPAPAGSTEAAIRRLALLDPSHITRDEVNGRSLNHRWSREELDALQVALAVGRPLLLRGEPGCGKTQLAAAVAAELGWALRALTVHPRMEPEEVVYRFDPVARLAAAHQGQGEAAVRDERRYYEPGPLWWALDWGTANEAGNQVRKEAGEPAGSVVLIDEIDKADADLPNSLLELFGERELRLPCEPGRLRMGGGEKPAPLILLTTNEDRDLPPPFLRRCVVLSLNAHANDPHWLVEHRGRTHFRVEGEDGDEDPPRPRLPLWVLQDAAQFLVDEQQPFSDAGRQPPGVAEYLDLLYALHQIQKSLSWSDERKRRPKALLTIKPAAVRARY